MLQTEIANLAKDAGSSDLGEEGLEFHTSH